MDVDDGVLVLFDRLWFRQLILLPCPTPPEVESPVINGDSQDAESIVSEPPSTISTPSALLLRRHRRSRSDDLPPLAELRIVPKLQTILSGKVAAEAPARMSVSIEAGTRQERDRCERRRKKGESKSLSDLGSRS
ncbi:hypothetical protein HPP92_004030 [Vanilla planifolia]|uniref:Uncharacterized protein n=1 Tax=Vanilla planifolia TaxID=51239 RepID=A0A835RW60_VANPL|nr:hypothetical protein HPP92_004030 [Vanilla planifolia]